MRLRTNYLTLAGMALLLIGGTVFMLEGHVDVPNRLCAKVGFGMLTLSVILYLAGRIMMFVGPRDR